MLILVSANIGESSVCLFLQVSLRLTYVFGFFSQTILLKFPRWAAEYRLLFFILILCLSPPTKTNTVMHKGSLRKYILLTLSHIESKVERGSLTTDLIIGRLIEIFLCRSIVISKEKHTALGYHYHIGIWNDNASKYTAVLKLRELFPEFEGRQLNVSFHKGWNTVCTYLLKEDNTPKVWGEESLDFIRERGRSAESKRRGPDLVKLLRSKDTWEEVLGDDALVKKCLSSYSSVRSTFTDLQAIKKTDHFLKILLSYVQSKGGLSYTASDLKERFEALHWLTLNLCRPRHLRQKQLLILGKPGTHKTSLVQALSEFLTVYFVSRREKDFTGAEREAHLWVIDELSGYEIDGDTLNMLLDGQKISLDTKYGRVFEKTKNVPIIMISNSFPYQYNTDAACSCCNFCQRMPANRPRSVGFYAISELYLILPGVFTNSGRP